MSADSDATSADEGVDSAGTTYDRLRTQILRGAFADDEWLKESALARQLGVSRTPVREALRRLHADGLVQLTKNRGARVTTLTEADLDAAYEVRAMLEGLGARRAAESREVDLPALRALCDEMEACRAEGTAAAFERVAELNLQLHSAIHATARSPLLPGVLTALVETSLVRQTFLTYSPAELQQSGDQHRQILDAIEAGDGAWAESIMRAHVAAARATLRRHAPLTSASPKEPSA